MRSGLKRISHPPHSVAPATLRERSGKTSISRSDRERGRAAYRGLRDRPPMRSAFRSKLIASFISGPREIDEDGLPSEFAELSRYLSIMIAARRIEVDTRRQRAFSWHVADIAHKPFATVAHPRGQRLRPTPGRWRRLRSRAQRGSAELPTAGTQPEQLPPMCLLAFCAGATACRRMVSKTLISLVRAGRLELPRPFGQQILS